MASFVEVTLTHHHLFIMTRLPTLLFLMGTVAVACNGAVIKGRPCDHYSDEEIKTEEQVLVNIPEAPMLPPFSSNALEFVAPLQDDTKSDIPEATTSLPSVPLSFQPVSIVSGDYTWPSASLYPNYPVNVLAGQAALDYPNVQIVPIPATPELSQIKEESLVAIPEAPVLPPFSGNTYNLTQSEQKEELPASPEISIGAAPVLPSWAGLSQYTPNYLPFPQMYGNYRDESSTFYQQPWSYYPIAPRPCEHNSGSSSSSIENQPNRLENPGAPVKIPFYAPALAPETESKPVSYSFPEASVMPSFSLSELPITNAVANDEVPATEGAVLMIIPEAPILPPFVAPEMPKEEITSATVSEVPVLPPFVAPELHLSEPITEEPKHEYDAVIEVTEPQPTYVNIPEAPVLPAFVAPEVHSVEADKPANEVNCDETVTESEQLLVIIPEAPVLPPFIAPAALPISATTNEEAKPEPASPCEEPKQEQYESFAPIFIPTAPVLAPYVAPEMPMEAEREPLPVSTEAPATTEVLYEEPEYEPQPLVPIPAAPVLPAFVAPEMPTVPMYDEPKSENCDKDKEYKPVAASYPYYLPIPASYALSSQSAVALPESAESIAECIRKILANHVSPSFYASLVPATQGLQQAPMVPLSSPFYYKPAMSNDLPVY